MNSASNNVLCTPTPYLSAYALSGRVHPIWTRTSYLDSYPLSGRLFWQVFQNITDEVRAIHALRLPFKVQDEAMAQARQRYGAEILDADMETSLEQRTHFAGQHQALHTAWARTIAHIPFDLLRRRWGLRVR